MIEFLEDIEKVPEYIADKKNFVVKIGGGWYRLNRLHPSEVYKIVFNNRIQSKKER